MKHMLDTKESGARCYCLYPFFLGLPEIPFVPQGSEGFDSNGTR